MFDGLELHDRMRIFSGAHPINAPAHTAASTFSRLCAPLSGISADSEHQPVPSVSPENNAAIANECSRFHFPWRLNQNTCAASAPGKLHAGRIVRVQHGEIVGMLVLENTGLGVDVSRKCPMAIQVVGRDVEHDRNSGTKTRNRLQLETRNLEHIHGFGRSFARPAKSPAVPMLPPTSVLNPPAAMISPTNVVVVVFPFDPVMATIGPGRNWEASSISPITGRPKARACSSGSASTGTPGLTTIKSCLRKVRSPCAPVSTAIPVEKRGICSRSWSSDLGVRNRDLRTPLIAEK